MEETGKGWPARHDVIDRLGSFDVARQAGAYGTHPFFKIGDNRQALALPQRQSVAGRQAVDCTLNSEEFVDAADRLDRQRRLPEISQLEELASPVAPARRLGDRLRLALAVVKFAEPGISIGLQNPGTAGEMTGRDARRRDCASRKTPPPTDRDRQTAGRLAHTSISER